jgi:hypothetical protein
MSSNRGKYTDIGINTVSPHEVSFDMFQIFLKINRYELLRRTRSYFTKIFLEKKTLNSINKH